MFYCLSPAGNPISSRASPDYRARLERVFAPYRAFYFQSGAAALAAALRAVVAQRPAGRRDVVLPAYGCPELVSAVLYAGGRPVLVDLAAERPWLDLAALGQRLDERVAAVVAVSLFGIPERTRELGEAVRGVGAALICDHAQWFPGSEGWAGSEADLAVVSFGRGKPVSVLGGGAVLTRTAELAGRMEAVAAEAEPADSGSSLLALKMAAYNALISPYLYWLPDSLPFLGLGETRFKSLAGVRGMDEGRLQRLPGNIEAYWGRGLEVQGRLAQVVGRYGDRGVVDLAVACCGEAVPRLLRFPLLCASRAQRDDLYERLRGLGASRMYQVPLPEIDGLTGMLGDQGAFPHAKAFAERILTLPTHQGVRGRDVARIEAVLCEVCGGEMAPALRGAKNRSA